MDTRTIDLNRFSTDEVEVDWSRPHFVGVGGSGMAPLALAWSQLAGTTVTGYDRVSSPTTAFLASCLAEVIAEGCADGLPPGSTCVVVSTAIADDHPQVIAAQRRGIPVVHRAQALDRLAAGRALVAVAGTSGKSTTAAMLTHILARVHGSASHVFGATWRGAPAGQMQDGDVLVAEADESDRSLTFLTPKVLAVTGIGNDHAENFTGIDDQVQMFAETVARMNEGTVILNTDDYGCEQLLERMKLLKQPPTVISYGESGTPDFGFQVTAITYSGSTAWLEGPSTLRTITVPAVGAHMIADAVAAIATAVQLGVSVTDAADALLDFRPLEGRMACVPTDTGGRYLVVSRAHNPGQIAADLSAAWSLVPAGGRVLSVFEPAGHARVHLYGEEVGSILGTTEHLVLLPVHAGITSGPPSSDVTRIAEAAEAAGISEVVRADSLMEAVQITGEASLPGDVIVVMGVSPQFNDIARIAESVRSARVQPSFT